VQVLARTGLLAAGSRPVPGDSTGDPGEDPAGDPDAEVQFMLAREPESFIS